jgi:anthranilate phosphoribosyltransferase
VILNAGAALTAAGRVPDIGDGIELAALTVDAGLAVELLDRLRAEKRAADAAAGTPQATPA